MELMDNSTFKIKYLKSKIRVKLWESNFIEKFGRKPNKNDIKTSHVTIREAYKMYWKLKTSALEQTLTEINFCKDSQEVLSNNTVTELIKSSEYKQFKSEKIFFNSKSNKLSHPIDFSSKIKACKLSQNLNIGVFDHCIHQNLNQDNIKNDQVFQINRSSFQLSKNMFKSINFYKRNLKKSELTKSEIELDTFSNHLRQYKSEICKDYEIPNIIQPSFNTHLKIIYEEKKISEQPTIQQLIGKYTKINNRQLNINWLRRYIENDIFENSKSKSLKLFRNCDSGFESYKNLLHKSFTYDEDYIYNSDSEDEHRKKRVRNHTKIVYDCSVQPSKRLCIISDDLNNTEINKQVLQNSLNDPNKSTIFNQLKSTLSNKKYIYFDDINDFDESNTDLKKKIVKKKFDKNMFKIKLRNVLYSQSKLQNIIHKQNFSEKEYKNENVIQDNTEYIGDQISIESLESKSLNVKQYSLKNRSILNDLTDFSSIKEPLNLETNTSLKYKSCKTTKYIKHNLHTEKFLMNENFIKINLKKKVFVRGKKFFNLSNYKKNQWKQRKKESSFYDTNLKLEDSIDNNRFICSKCGQIGHFARYCKHSKSSLLLINEHKDISTYPILEDVKVSEQLNIVGINDAFIPYVICQNMLTKPPETMNCHYSKNINSQKETVIDSKNLVIYNKSENLKRKLMPQIQEIHPLYELNADNSVKDTPLEVIAVLKKFGYNEFRPGQEKAIMRILSGQSSLITLATGSGKSLCYQLPAYMYSKKSACITLVISPLVSLMDDQISRIPNFLEAACLHTNQKLTLQKKILTNLKNGKLNILLISPELIVGSEISNDFGKILYMLPPIAFVCIDEVHCISEWSHNFRPAYFTICKILKEKLGVKTFLGLTATASKSTIMNIVNFLNIKDEVAGVISESFIPFNLNLTVSRDHHKEEALIELLQSERFTKCDSIIVYCTQREECVRVAKILRIYFQDLKSSKITSKVKISSIAEAYHAGLSAYRRKIVYNSFMKSQIRIIVATVAFGMGINKPNIRSVIHFNMPPNFERYVQEIGRAGRDSLPAHCHLFLSPKENSDEFELRRYINANKVDRHTIRLLLQKILVPCNCINLHSKLRCLGHEIAFSIDETVQTLDLSVETITTLLYYLERHPKQFIKLLPSTYINAKISSYEGPNILKLAAKSTPLLELALTLLRKNGQYTDNDSTIKFAIIDIASAIGLDSLLVKHQLKNLEWITVDGKTKKSAISVKFDTLGFRVIAFGDLTNEEMDEALESIIEQNQLHTKICMQQLQYFSTTIRKFSFASAKECFKLNKNIYSKSEELKNIVYNYFKLDEPLSNIYIPLETKLKNEARIVVDIRNLILSYNNVRFTGRSVARIFHGIQSPNYSALFWSKSHFWRAHITENYDAICQLATKEIFKIKKM